MKEESITQEVHRLIDEKIAAGLLVQTDFVAHEILNMKRNIDGEDAPFYRVCAFKEVVRIAKRVVGKYDAAETTSEQIVLPGFKHLCKAYPMTRNGVVTLVPVDKCTSVELSNRADQLIEMAKGCRDHAKEIREYVSSRIEALAS